MRKGKQPQNIQVDLPSFELSKEESHNPGKNRGSRKKGKGQTTVGQASINESIWRPGEGEENLYSSPEGRRLPVTGEYRETERGLSGNGDKFGAVIPNHITLGPKEWGNPSRWGIHTASCKGEKDGRASAKCQKAGKKKGVWRKGEKWDRGKKGHIW